MIKRGLDITLSLLALLMFSPLLIGVAIFVGVKIGRPILFVQERAGRNGRSFRMYKFRTMTNAVDATGELLPDADRLTAAGKFLRASSLDELPELLNILKGEMSLVGPRPLLVRYLSRYTPAQARRHEVRPGLTGLAQVKGRNALSWDEKFALDVWYVDHRSFLLDLQIVVLTAMKIFDRRGISASDSATMTEFMGGSSTARAAQPDATEQEAP